MTVKLKSWSLQQFGIAFADENYCSVPYHEMEKEIAERYEFSKKSVLDEFNEQSENFAANPSAKNWNSLHAIMIVHQSLHKGNLVKYAKD